jgi:hypothetical protein
MVFIKMVIDDVLRILKLEHWFTQSLFVLNLSNRTEFYLWCNENSISIIHVGTFYGGGMSGMFKMNNTECGLSYGGNNGIYQS